MKKIIFTLLFFAAIPCVKSAEPVFEIAKKNEINIIDSKPLLELLAERNNAAFELKAGKEKILATYVFDDSWEKWFSLKHFEKPFLAFAVKETELNKEKEFDFSKEKVRVWANDTDIYLKTSGSDILNLSKISLFSKIYDKSSKITFGEIITYSVTRNLAPLSENEGIVTMRKDKDGNFFYSLTKDKDIRENPRWILAINGILYGIKIEEGELKFVSKKINIEKLTFFIEEKILKPVLEN